MEQADSVTRQVMMSTGQFGQILTQLLDRSSGNRERTLKEIFGELADNGIIPLTTEIENKDVRRFEEAAIRHGITVKGVRLDSGDNRNVVTYMFNGEDREKVADILHELGIEIDRNRDLKLVNPYAAADFCMTQGEADRVFGRDGGKYIAQAGGLTMLERYVLQRTLAEAGVKSFASIDPVTAEGKVSVLDTDIEKLEIACARMEERLAMFKKPYENEYERYHTLSSMVQEPEKFAGTVVFDSKNPSNMVEILKDGIKICSDYGHVQVDSFSLRSEDISDRIKDAIGMFAAPDYMKKEDYNKAEPAELHRYEAKTMNQTAIISNALDKYHEKFRQEELKAEEKMSINVNGRSVLYFNAEQTVGEFFDTETREDIRDVAFDVKLSELDDLMNDRISALKISSEMYIVQDPERAAGLEPEIDLSVAEQEEAVLLPEAVAEEVGDNDLDEHSWDDEPF